MKVIATLSFLILFVALSLADTISFDTRYDNRTDGLTTAACSDGPNGLITKGYTTFGSLPKFPYIGGAQAITGWNSNKCGTCWALTYKGKTINVLAVDRAKSGFNIAKEAMDVLTGGHADEFGRINGTATEVAASACGV